MAETIKGAELRVEDFAPVRSRVSWGPVLAGAVVAMATFLILTLFAGAIGLTIGEDWRTTSMGYAAAIWAVLSTIASLFLGGWVTTQCTAGENRTEAVVHGVIMWGAVLAMMLWLAGTGVNLGFNAMVGIGQAAASRDVGDWEAAARRAGVRQETINEWKRTADQAGDEARAAANDPESREAARDLAARGTWLTLTAVLLSLGAAVAGAVVGSGPSFRLFVLDTRSGAVRHTGGVAAQH